MALEMRSIKMSHSSSNRLEFATFKTMFSQQSSTSFIHIRLSLFAFTTMALLTFLVLAFTFLPPVVGLQP